MTWFQKSVCETCIAKDYFIASLKEIIHQKDAQLDQLRGQLIELEEKMFKVLEHTTGMDRVYRPPGEMHSMPRNQGIQARIKEAEKAREAPPELVAERRRAFENRIQEEENAIQNDVR